MFRARSTFGFHYLKRTFQNAYREKGETVFVDRISKSYFSDDNCNWHPTSVMPGQGNDQQPLERMNGVLKSVNPGKKCMGRFVHETMGMIGSAMSK